MPFTFGDDASGGGGGDGDGYMGAAPTARVVTDDDHGSSMDARAFSAAEAALRARVRDDPSLILQEGGGGNGGEYYDSGDGYVDDDGSTVPAGQPSMVATMVCVP